MALAAVCAMSGMYWLVAIAAVGLRLWWPAFRDLASYGEQRALRPPSATASGRGWAQQVSKRRGFMAFYIVGTVVATGLLSFVGTAACPVPGLVSADAAWPMRLFVLHMVRRLLETGWLQRFSPTSTMSRFGAVAGASFYVVAPLTVWSSSCAGAIDAAGGTTRWFGVVVALNIGQQLIQADCHRRLSRTRADPKGTSGRPRFADRCGGLFRLLNWPHYVSEVGLYVTWAVMLNMLWWQTDGRSGWSSTISCAVVLSPPWLLALFSLLNLGATAASSPPRL